MFYLCTFSNKNYEYFTNRIEWSGSQVFLGKISNLFTLCNKSFDQKLPDVLALAGFSMFGLTILCSCHSRD